MERTRIGLQLYAVRGECGKDLGKTLEAIGRLGYEGVEPWGYDGSGTDWMGHKAADMRSMLAASGLACCGMHVSTGALMGDALSRTVELNRTLGNRFLIVAADKERMAGVAGIADLASILNRAAKAVGGDGMLVGYHAHGFDFNRIGGRTAWDILFSGLDAEVVMQLDTGNCAAGGGDPVAVLEKFPGRARSVHLKEHGGPAGSVIGEGALPWLRIFELCGKLHRTEWYVVEEGEESGAGFDASRRSLEALNRMGK